MEFIEYPKCSTCKKAKKYLLDNNISFVDRDITTNTPTYDELKTILDNYNIEVNKLFNTSGIKYRQLNLKEKLKDMSEDEKLKLLASDGMLIKRPLLITNNRVLIGFKERKWEILKEEER